MTHESHVTHWQTRACCRFGSRPSTEQSARTLRDCGRVRDSGRQHSGDTNGGKVAHNGKQRVECPPSLRSALVSTATVQVVANQLHCGSLQ